jgi:hypothetical protein
MKGGRKTDEDLRNSFFSKVLRKNRALGIATLDDATLFPNRLAFLHLRSIRQAVLTSFPKSVHLRPTHQMLCKHEDLAYNR